MYNLDFNENPSHAMSFIFKSKIIILFLTGSKCINSRHTSTSYAGFLAGVEAVVVNVWLGLSNSTGAMPALITRCVTSESDWHIARLRGSESGGGSAVRQRSTTRTSVQHSLTVLYDAHKRSSRERIGTMGQSAFYH
jgi:hypothetical protein